ncbi:hypothetical protein F4818DRAFT_433885 [Hypoxylon cercidicola]|nr:hypothetical protein F4818DRAFT_433885 [Hypoxylon cercidicola]
MASSSPEDSADENRIDFAITQLNVIKSNSENELRLINSTFEETRKAIENEFKQKLEQIDRDLKVAIEMSKRSYKEETNLLFAKLISPLKQQDRKPLGEVSAGGQAEANRLQDSFNNTKEEIGVIVLDSDSESSASQLAVGGQPNIADQGSPKASEQPAPRIRKRKRTAKAKQTDNDVQTDTPQTKKVRRGRPPKAFAKPTSRVSTGEPSHKGQPSPHETVPPHPTSVHRKKDVSKGITDPKVGEIYKIQDGSYVAGYAALVLPRGDFDEIGISRSIHDTDLRKIPPCYWYNEQDMSIIGWQKDYDDGGPKVNERKFPCMVFKDDTEIPLEGKFTAADQSFKWISAEAFRSFDLPANASRFIKGWKTANKFSERLRLIREKRANQNRRAGDTIRRPAVEGNGTDGQIPRDAPNGTSTDDLPSQPAVDNAPHENGPAPESSRSRPRGEREQTEHLVDEPDEVVGPQLPPQPQRDFWSLRSLEEINQQHPDPAPGETGYSSDGIFPLPQDELAEQDEHQRAFGWLPTPLASMADVVDADWGNCAAFMDMPDGPHGLEVVTPRAQSPHINTGDGGQTMRANDDSHGHDAPTSPRFPPRRSEAAMPSAPGTSTRDETVDRISYLRAVAEQENLDRQIPPSLRNAAREALRRL